MFIIRSFLKDVKWYLRGYGLKFKQQSSYSCDIMMFRDVCIYTHRLEDGATGLEVIATNNPDIFIEKQEGGRYMEGKSRIEQVRGYVDGVIRRIPNYDLRKEALIHLYGVSQACGMIAMKRKENVELAVVAGMLHDIWTYTKMDSKEHAHKGAGLAKEILKGMGIFEEEEIETVCHAIYHHSGKAICQEPFDEVLKDADVWEHCMYDPQKEPSAKEYARFEKLKGEFGLS